MIQSALSMFTIQEPNTSLLFQRTNLGNEAFALGQSTKQVKLQKIDLKTHRNLMEGPDENKIKEICKEQLKKTRELFRANRLKHLRDKQKP